MNFEKTLISKKKDIVKLWFEATINTYPSETAKFFNKSKNKFDNPVGIATYESLETAFNILCENLMQPQGIDISEELLEQALDSVIRIRAVQSFSASEAVGFVFELKDIVQNIIGKDIEPFSDRNFDRKVDQTEYSMAGDLK